MRLPGLILAALSLGAAAGCSSPDLDDLPSEPGKREEPQAPVAGTIKVSASDPGALTPAVDGESILPGVVLLEPLLKDGSTATFAVRNDTGRDLPDLILSVIFAVAPAGGPEGKKGPVVPRFESIEAPLRSGETRKIQATLASLLEGETTASFRVAAGIPEILAAGDDGHPGTTFLGGLLECVSLDADLTAEHRTVVVGLADRAGAGTLPALEAQLLFGRAGELRWSGPWILVPRSGEGGSRERRIQWNLDGAPSLTACDCYLRVREKR